MFFVIQGGTKIELGANWIHGILGNPLYELAVSHNLVDVAQVRYTSVTRDKMYFCIFSLQNLTMW